MLLLVDWGRLEQLHRKMPFLMHRWLPQPNRFKPVLTYTASCLEEEENNTNLDERRLQNSTSQLTTSLSAQSLTKQDRETEVAAEKYPQRAPKGAIDEEAIAQGLPGSALQKNWCAHVGRKTPNKM